MYVFNHPNFATPAASGNNLLNGGKFVWLSEEMSVCRAADCSRLYLTAATRAAFNLL
jgi:hypothetical protein